MTTASFAAHDALDAFDKIIGEELE